MTPESFLSKLLQPPKARLVVSVVYGSKYIAG